MPHKKRTCRPPRAVTKIALLLVYTRPDARTVGGHGQGVASQLSRDRRSCLASLLSSSQSFARRDNVLGWVKQGNCVFMARLAEQTNVAVRLCACVPGVFASRLVHPTDSCGVPWVSFVCLENNSAVINSVALSTQANYTD
jgi:hypothetical protein